MTYQTRTGPLMANSHPGSYCGQDAYMDMLVTNDGALRRKRTTAQCRDAADSKPIGHDARSTDYFEGGLKWNIRFAA